MDSICPIHGASTGMLETGTCRGVPGPTDPASPPLLTTGRRGDAYGAGVRYPDTVGDD